LGLTLGAGQRCAISLGAQLVNRLLANHNLARDRCCLGTVAENTLARARPGGRVALGKDPGGASAQVKRL
jgi:hypothetical protein